MSFWLIYLRDGFELRDVKLTSRQGEGQTPFFHELWSLLPEFLRADQGYLVMLERFCGVSPFFLQRGEASLMIRLY